MVFFKDMMITVEWANEQCEPEEKTTWRRK